MRDDWKNPSRSNPWEEWSTPAVADEKDSISLSLLIRGVLGFMVITAINALALFLFLHALDYRVPYRSAVIASAIYVCWRVYDIVLFRKIKKD